MNISPLGLFVQHKLHIEVHFLRKHSEQNAFDAINLEATIIVLMNHHERWISKSRDTQRAAVKIIHFVGEEGGLREPLAGAKLVELNWNRFPAIETCVRIVRVQQRLALDRRPQYIHVYNKLLPKSLENFHHGFVEIVPVLLQNDEIIALIVKVSRVHLSGEVEKRLEIVAKDYVMSRLPVDAIYAGKVFELDD